MREQLEKERWKMKREREREREREMHTSGLEGHLHDGGVCIRGSQMEHWEYVLPTWPAGNTRGKETEFTIQLLTPSTSTLPLLQFHNATHINIFLHFNGDYPLLFSSPDVTSLGTDHLCHTSHHHISYCHCPVYTQGARNTITQHSTGVYTYIHTFWRYI